MMKKGHKRKNWTERWFLLKPNLISYYVHEDLAEHKGDILLDGNCTVEVSSGSPTRLCDGGFPSLSLLFDLCPDSAPARQRGQKVPLHHQVTAEEFRDQRVG